MEDRNDEEVEEWGLMLPPAALHEGREVPQVASQMPVPSHRGRLLSRRLVVGGRGIGHATAPWVEQEEQPHQRRRLRLLSQSTGVGVGTKFHTITSDAEPMALAEAGVTQVDGQKE